MNTELCNYDKTNDSNNTVLIWFYQKHEINKNS